MSDSLTASGSIGPLPSSGFSSDVSAGAPGPSQSTIDQAYALTWDIGINNFLAYTVGLLWRAGTGTVDPWLKQSQIQNDALDHVVASGGTISLSDALAQATADTEAVLKQAGADPSQASISKAISDALDKIKAGVATSLGISPSYVVPLLIGLIALISAVVIILKLT